ncbi:MAG: BrnA antitoxin family protein [Candidatus Sulfotelmatobacter sp.]|jgi:uncharacterized protein (DUF4415 family)
MKPGKRVKKVRRPKRREAISLSAVAEEPRPRRRYVLLRDVLENFKPLKKPVTLRLDADVVAWFKKSGPGYQTRINLALRKLVEEQKRAVVE